jgi:alpha/beta superfamily hydrolase
MITTTAIRKEIADLIEGPAGQLEVVRANPIGKDRKAFGIVCHPHPLFGGTMDNKVVTTLTKTFQHLGLYTARFNFRGVGRSAGAYDHGDGELDDLIAVVDWMKQQHPENEIWLAGFSFGGYIAAKAATILPISKLVLVAPAVHHFPMQDLPPITCPWILVQGEQDDVVPPDAVFAWAETRNPKPIILRFPEAGHFFHGQLGELRARLEEVL